MLLTQQPQVRFPAFQIFFRGKIINIAEVNQHGWLDKSGHWLENVDQNHLVLASGEPVLPKTPFPDPTDEEEEEKEEEDGAEHRHRRRRQVFRRRVLRPRPDRAAPGLVTKVRTHPIGKPLE